MTRFITKCYYTFFFWLVGKIFSGVWRPTPASDAGVQSELVGVRQEGSFGTEIRMTTAGRQLTTVTYPQIGTKAFCMQLFQFCFVTRVTTGLPN